MTREARQATSCISLLVVLDCTLLKSVEATISRSDWHPTIWYLLVNWHYFTTVSFILLSVFWSVMKVGLLSTSLTIWFPAIYCLVCFPCRVVVCTYVAVFLDFWCFMRRLSDCVETWIILQISRHGAVSASLPHGDAVHIQMVEGHNQVFISFLSSFKQLHNIVISPLCLECCWHILFVAVLVISYPKVQYCFSQ